MEHLFTTSRYEDLSKIEEGANFQGLRVQRFLGSRAYSNGL